MLFDKTLKWKYNKKQIRKEAFLSYVFGSASSVIACIKPFRTAVPVHFQRTAQNSFVELYTICAVAAHLSRNRVWTSLSFWRLACLRHFLKSLTTKNTIRWSPVFSETCRIRIHKIVKIAQSRMVVEVNWTAMAPRAQMFHGPSRDALEIPQKPTTKNEPNWSDYSTGMESVLVWVLFILLNGLVYKPWWFCHPTQNSARSFYSSHHQKTRQYLTKKPTITWSPSSSSFLQSWSFQMLLEYVHVILTRESPAFKMKSSKPTEPRWGSHVVPRSFSQCPRNQNAHVCALRSRMQPMNVDIVQVVGWWTRTAVTDRKSVAAEPWYSVHVWRIEVFRRGLFCVKLYPVRLSVTLRVSAIIVVIRLFSFLAIVALKHGIWNV